MTIALGFNCPDGIVLCADSMDTDGYTKTKVDKIWCYETQDEWGIAVAVPENLTSSVASGVMWRQGDGFG
jgi:hypothetical protein